MKLAVFGPTGRTGRLILEQALATGHEVTAFTRHPEAVPARQGLTVVAGSTNAPALLAQAIAGRDAVLCALGGHPLRRRENVCSTAMRAIVAVMQDCKVRRIVAMSTFGAGETRPHVGWFARTVLFGSILRSEVADKEAMEATLSGTTLDWTVVRVGLLTDDPQRMVWRAADDGSIRGMGKIARADVAAFMLAQLHHSPWVRRSPVIMY
ncbi:MAG TPA: SDR family oxidoreductase [Burkholderiales bacterium]|nr:SDR family oxidoreductase [Burkholderiales bacterium]